MGEIYIKIIKQGPYEVFGLNRVGLEEIVPDEEGASWEYKRTGTFALKESPAALCRCGHSKHPPFCDGSHQHADWDGTEARDFRPIMEGAEAFEGPNLTLYDNEAYCAYARFCDAKGRVWNLVGMGTEETDKLTVREAWNCPAGRLMIKKRGSADLSEPELKPEISVLEDRPLGCSGPLRVNGGIRVESADGRSYEIRNRRTLCRCGQSGHKPYCDGSHAGVGFQDGL